MLLATQANISCAMTLKLLRQRLIVKAGPVGALFSMAKAEGGNCYPGRVDIGLNL